MTKDFNTVPCPHIQQHVAGRHYRWASIPCCECYKDSEVREMYYGGFDHILTKIKVRRDFTTIKANGDIVTKNLKRRLWWPKDEPLLPEDDVVNLIGVLERVCDKYATANRAAASDGSLPVPGNARGGLNRYRVVDAREEEPMVVRRATPSDAPPCPAPVAQPTMTGRMYSGMYASEPHTIPATAPMPTIEEATRQIASGLREMMNTNFINNAPIPNDSFNNRAYYVPIGGTSGIYAMGTTTSGDTITTTFADTANVLRGDNGGES